MTNPKLLQRLKRIYWAIWLVGLATGVFTLAAEAAPEKETLCHFGETIEVPSPAVEGHLGHGDYLGECVVPEPEFNGVPVPPSSEPSAYPLYRMWLLTSDRHISFGKGELVFPAYYQCLIRSETHPSVERQGALCFADQFDGQWIADDAPCAAPVMSDGSWKCDLLTQWRLR